MKRTILLADDSATIQRLVERTFEGSEFVVEAVSNGEAAVRALDELTPAAVLADIYMPGKNGYEVCAYVKQHPKLAQTPVVLLVGAFEVFDEEQATRVGADLWITKPFEPKHLTQTVAGLALRSSSAVPGDAGASGEAAVDAHGAVGAQEREDVPTPVATSVAGTAEEAPVPRHGRPLEPVAEDEGVPAHSVAGDDADLLGLEELFPQAPPRRALSEEEVEAIADRVIDRLSTEVVESIAWDIVPEIADRVMKDESRKKE